MSLLLLFRSGGPGAIHATAAIAVTAAATLTAPVPLRATATIHISAAGNVAPPGFAAAGVGIQVGAAGGLTTTGRFRATSGFTFATTLANLSPPGLSSDFTTIRFIAVGTLTGAPRELITDITIDGIDVRGRVRVDGLTIRDVLNDAPNTCTFIMEGDGPAVGQAIRITQNGGARVLFAGTIQTVDQSYESLPRHVAWHVNAIDDTAKANARRPFRTFFDASATAIAETITAEYAPGFSTGGIAPGLPAVTIVFDGSDPFIACLTKLATAIGGYCKIENGTIYLFIEDTGEQPNPINPFYPFLNSPPIQANVDSSQLRTRVYGKGYGESIQADLAAGESLVPIEDGVMFPPLGGDAIVGLTADGAQSERVHFSGVELAGGGTLVGPGASPTTAPILSIAGGTGPSPGPHTVSVVYVTGNGKTLPSPPGSIVAGVHAPPASPPVAAAALSGTGPDQGSHDYAASFVTAYGETTPGPISNAVGTSAAAGQILAPGPLSVQWPALQGAGLTDGYHSYRVTFVNTNGETEGGQATGYYGPVQSVLEGGSPPIAMQGWQGQNQVTTGGSVEPGYYFYWFTGITAQGETVSSTAHLTASVGGAGTNAVNVQSAWSSDPRCTGIKIYRSRYEENPNVSPASSHFIATIPNPTTSPFYWKDTISHASTAGNPPPPTVDTTAIPGTMVPYNRIQLIYIPLGPAGTTARKIYRAFSPSADYYLIGTLNNNTATEYVDASPNNFGAPSIPSSNGTGTAQQRIPVSNIPIGPVSVTGRKLYRRFNGAGAFRLVTTINNNTGTTFTDGVPNSGLGANALTNPTAVGYQIAVQLPKGPAAVTARELYMSPTDNQDYRLLATVINDNTTAVGYIVIPDSGLVGQPTEPISDTSGLQQPNGQVNPGSTVIPLASAAPFRLAGGWVVLGGGQVVKYAGVSGQTLIGVPPEGPGAIHTTVLYGSQAIPAPMLTGVVGLTRPVLKGGAVHIWIQRDDLQAQAEQIARAGGDGVIEYLIVDERRGVESLAALCDADLAMFSRPIVTVAYATRDQKTLSGKTVVVDLDSPRIHETLIIQEVTITEIDIAVNLAPRYGVRASNVRFSLEDMLRRLVATV